MCQATGSIMSRNLVVDPKTKGVAYAIRLLVQAQGRQHRSRSRTARQEPRRSCSTRRTASFSLTFFHSTKTRSWSSNRATRSATTFGSRGSTTPASIRWSRPRPSSRSSSSRKSVPMELQCDIHHWMKGYLLVLDHPFFATTADRRFLRDQGRSGRRQEPDRLAEQDRICQARAMAGGMPVVGQGRRSDRRRRRSRSTPPRPTKK